MADYENAADELAALMNGELKLEEVDNTDDNDDNVNNDDTDNEDTDQSTGSDDDNDTNDAETNGTTDDDSQATDDGDTDNTDNDDEANTQVDETNSDDTGSDDDNDTTTDDNDNGDDDTDTPSDDSASNDDSTDGDAGNTGTEGQNDGDGSDTDTTDYKKQYEELLQKHEVVQGFYDEVTSEFTANGKKMKGFSDPKKVIQAQQMAAGFGEKMSAFKAYRPFMSAIKEQGWLDNPEQFDMAVNLMKKDPEAIKKLIKESSVDVLDLDLENINYTGESHRASTPEIALDDMLVNARNVGVEADIQKVLGGKWLEDGSLPELLSNQEETQAFVHHMVKDEDGTSAYDDVQLRVSEKLRTDYSGVYGNKSSYQQYKIAAGELEQELAAINKQEKLDKLKEAQVTASKVADEKAKIEAERKQREYEAKVKQENEKNNAARAKATNASTPKRKSKAKSKAFDPIDESHTLEGDAFMEYFNKNILGKNY